VVIELGKQRTDVLIYGYDCRPPRHTLSSRVNRGKTGGVIRAIDRVSRNASSS
jgi:hypothetical protein